MTGPQSTQPDRLRGLTEAAVVHGIARTTLAELLKTGQIGYVRHGERGERRIPDSEIRKYIERRIVRAGGD